jgi:hypothetical protein
MIPCSLVGRYQHYREICCLHLQGVSENDEDAVTLYNQVAKKMVHGRVEETESSLGQ